MKPLLLIALCVLTLAVHAKAQSYRDGELITDWTLMVESPTGKLYFASESVRRNSDIIKVWLRVDFPFGSDAVQSEPLRAGRDFGSIRGYGVINCLDLNATSGPALVLYYDRNGKLVKRQKETEKVHGNKEPNALTSIFEYFCEAVEVPVVGPPRLKSRP